MKVVPAEICTAISPEVSECFGSTFEELDGGHNWMVHCYERGMCMVDLFHLVVTAEPTTSLWTSILKDALSLALVFLKM